MIKRTIEVSILNSINNDTKIIVIYGARQVGKTTLINSLLDSTNKKVIRINADIEKYNTIFSSRDLDLMIDVIDDNEIIFIDEAQNIKDIGVNLKIIYDSLPKVKIIVTGSSSFELANKIKEPLTGRTKTFHLYPISIGELRQTQSPFELKNNLENYMLYGMYPEIRTIKSNKNKIEHLRELASAYLYRDVLQLSNIKHSDKIHKLLKLLAFQMGSLVSIHELSKQLKMSFETVNNYIDLLEKGFILFRLSGYSGNLRKEVTKMDKIYFYDLGVRNMLIDNFNSLEFRHDKGALWENFLIMERIKKTSYHNEFSNNYFWRTYSGAELDYVEEANGKLNGFEFKWKSNKVRKPKTWLENYSNATFTLINKANFLEFVL